MAHLSRLQSCCSSDLEIFSNCQQCLSAPTGFTQKGRSPYILLLPPQSHPAPTREHRSPLHAACSVKQTAYGIPGAALWSHLVWLLFLQLVINKNKLGIWGGVMLDIHTLTARMVLYQDYRLPGRGADRGEPHTAACRLYSLFPATSRR